MASTGLSADPKEYRTRLADQSDDQIDAWAAELMRDVAIRRGVVKVVADFRHAGGLDECRFRTGVRIRRRTPGDHRARRKGRLMVPAITLFALVPGIRAQLPDGRDRLVEYLVENFDEIVYV